MDLKADVGYSMPQFRSLLNAARLLLNELLLLTTAKIYSALQLTHISLIKLGKIIKYITCFFIIFKRISTGDKEKRGSTQIHFYCGFRRSSGECVKSVHDPHHHPHLHHLLYVCVGGGCQSININDKITPKHCESI